MFGTSPVDIVILIGSTLVALVVHEFMHAFTAHQLGDTTAFEAGRVSLNPLRHIDPIMTIVLPIVTLLIFKFPMLAAKPVPFNTARVKYDDFGAALIALAGPLSNLVMAFIGAFIATQFGAGTMIVHILQTFAVLNVIIFVFNMIPIPPLDGSRVLYAFAPEPVRRIFEQIEPIGFFIILALVVTGGFGSTLSNLNTFILNLLP